MSSLTCYASQGGWQNCYSVPNNYDFNAPARMSDGRLWSQWSPDAVVNQQIQQQQGIHTNWEYRRYLQHNALSVMHYNSKEACYTMGLDHHQYTLETPSSNVPFRFQGVFDMAKPGYGYCNSDLKSPYLSREQLNARLIAPAVVPQQKKTGTFL